MNTALILIVSGILIGAGFSMLWRDFRRSRRSTFVSERDIQPAEEPEVEITISTRPTNGRGAEAHVESRPIAQAPALQSEDEAGNPKETVTETEPVTGPTVTRDEDGVRLPAIEQYWAALQPIISAGVAQLNAELARRQIRIADSGDPAWSYRNKGYGAYRRLLIAEESMGWLRLEITQDCDLRATLKAHQEERADLNAVAHMSSAQLNPASAYALVAQCVKPAIAHAAKDAGQADCAAGASEAAWSSIEPTIMAALRATNGALAQAGARLLLIAPAAWVPEVERYRMIVCVEVNGSDVARMHIERIDEEVEVAVGVRDAHLAELGRRRRIPVEGMTIHSLAELIASCAWPAIARTREVRRSA